MIKIKKQLIFNFIIAFVLLSIVFTLGWLIKWNMDFQDAVYQMKVNTDNEFFAIESKIYTCCGGTTGFNDTGGLP